KYKLLYKGLNWILFAKTGTSGGDGSAQPDSLKYKLLYKGLNWILFAKTGTSGGDCSAQPDSLLIIFMRLEGVWNYFMTGIRREFKGFSLGYQLETFCNVEKEFTFLDI
ncbi:hypothetical protein ACJX0J_007838, partial [Zea mays]